MCLAGKRANSWREVALEGLQGVTPVEEVLLLGAVMLGVGLGAKAALHCCGRVLRGYETLAEAGVEGQVLELCVGGAGGMQGADGEGRGRGPRLWVEGMPGNAAADESAGAVEPASSIIASAQQEDSEAEQGALSEDIAGLLGQLTQDLVVIDGAVLRFEAMLQAHKVSARTPGLTEGAKESRKLARLTSIAEEREMTQRLFDEIDFNRDGIISVEELQAAIDRYKALATPLHVALATALERLLQQHADIHSGCDITLETFRSAVTDLPRVRGELVHFAQNLRLQEILAGLLPKGTFIDGLDGLKRLAGEKTESEAAEFAREVAQLFSAELEAVLYDSILKLREVSSLRVTALEHNSKFSMDPDAFKGSFASLDHFYQGPEKLIGTPNPQANQGILREHCDRKNADIEYTTFNYNLLTSPRKEYFFVVDPSQLCHDSYSHVPSDRNLWTEEAKSTWKGKYGRDIIELRHFIEHATARKAGLREAEVVALRLYTGPMYMWYNAVLRQYPKDLWESLNGNRYETTIFCIISGIIKLSKLTVVPEDRRLYRGLGGMLLPETFWHKAEGFRGGVEWGLMSSTTDRSVATQYSGVEKQRGTVFEISVGRIDIGADLSWVSQYPHEKEVLFPPLSCLEVIGEPHVEDEVIMIPLRINMCLKGLTLEQLIERRKDLHGAMVTNLKEELSIQAPAVFSIYESVSSPAVAAVLKSVEEQFGAMEKRFNDTPADLFNDDNTYKSFTAEAIEGKYLALRKVQIFADQMMKGVGPDTLDAIILRPFEDFASRAVVLELETGMMDFPWRDVLDQNIIVNFGHWRPEGIEQEKLNLALKELCDNKNFRSAVVLDDDGQEHCLQLPPEGFEATRLEWYRSGAITVNPALAALFVLKCTGLQELFLSYNEIGDAGATALAPSLEALTSLQWLSLNGNKISDAGATALAPALASCDTISTLYLEGNLIGDPGAAILAPALARLTHIHTLDLSANQIRDDGAHVLAAALKHLTTVQALDIQNNMLSTTGIESCRALLGLGNCFYA